MSACCFDFCCNVLLFDCFFYVIYSGTLQLNTLYESDLTGESREKEMGRREGVQRGNDHPQHAEWPSHACVAGVLFNLVHI